MSAQIDYNEAVAELEKFCSTETRFSVEISTENYPVKVTFYPGAQIGMFDADLYNVDENGEVGNISVSLGQETRVSSTLKFSLPAKLLNKMVKLSEKVGVTYLHAFRENIQLAPSWLKRAAEMAFKEFWQTSIPKVSVGMLDHDKFDKIIDRIFSEIIANKEEHLIRIESEADVYGREQPYLKGNRQPMDGDGIEEDDDEDQV